MLYITISRNTLYFNDLSDELFEVLKEKYPKLKVVPKKPYSYRIEGSPSELYKILHELSYTYDIELS